MRGCLGREREFSVSWPPRGVSNMVVPNWHHVFLPVQATQSVSNMVAQSWHHVLLRVQATQS
eukprot:542148-Pyramimonas_sp.AAC.1